MELYDKKYVYFEWDDKLEGKKCFVGADISYIKKQVNKSTDTITEIHHSFDNTKPFTTGYYNYSFAYYDPNYETKKAYNEGKKLQWKYRYEKQWKDWNEDTPPCFRDDTCGYELRVKPEQYLVIIKTALKIEFGISESKIKNYIKHGYIYFKGTYEECKDWIKRRTLRDLQVAYEWEFNGKNIYYITKDGNKSGISTEGIVDFDNYNYSLYPNIKNAWYVTFDEQGFVKSNIDDKNEILLFCGSDDECSDFIEKYKEYKDVLKSYARGETVQCFKNGKWKDINFNNEIISFDFLFRIKHEIDYDTGIIDNEVLDRPLTKEPEKNRIITNKELGMWLAKGNGQFMNKRTGIIGCNHVYNTDDNMELDYNFMVRRWGDEKWYDPTYNYCFVGIRR